MNITLDQIKELRKATGAGVTNVKEALENSKGDMDKAILYLREKGMAKAAKRAGKVAEKGFIGHYIHGEGSVGVLVELNAETDFTTRNEKFKELAHEIAIHIAAGNPQYTSVEDIPADIMQREKDLASKGIDDKKPQQVREQIIEGKLNKFYEETVLLKQKYFRDDSKTIEDLVSDVIAAIGEKIVIGRFCRIQIAQGSNSCGL